MLHYDPPDDPTLLDRSGQTAHAGEDGLVVTLVEWDQVNEVLGIQRQRRSERSDHQDVLERRPASLIFFSWQPPEDQAPFKAGSPTRRRRFSGPRQRNRSEHGPP